MSTSRLAVLNLALLLGFACLTANLGCATVVAMRIPGPVADESVAVGMHRAEVETYLRYAQRYEYPEPPDATTVRYEYKDGPHQGSKGRVVLYIAGDIFTLFLSELVFWPIELYASDRTERVATAYFDGSNRLAMWTIARPAGKGVLVTMGERPAPVAEATTKSTAGSPPAVSTGPDESTSVELDRNPESQAEETATEGVEEPDQPDAPGDGP